MKADMLVKGARIVNAWGMFEGWFTVKNGVITALGSGSGFPEADIVIDAEGKHVLPGAIDPHTHLAFCRPFEEDIESETRSAAVGGVTTLMTMLVHPGTYLEIIDKRIKDVEEKAMVDVSYHACMMSPQHLDELDQYVAKGVSSFKFLMAYKGEEGRNLGVQCVDDGSMLRAFKTISQIGHPALPMIHAENIEIIEELTRDLIKEGRDGLGAWADARPGYCEALDIQKAARYAKEADCPLYVVHVSSAESVSVIAEAKSKGVKIIAETCPQYLCFTRDEDFGVLGKVNPPIKSKKDLEMIWWGVENGIIDNVGTDHCAVMKKDKHNDIWSSILAFPGTATMLPSLLSEGVNKGRLTLEKVAALTSFNTAKAFGLYPQKGYIGVGSDADFIMIDLDLEKKVTASDLHSASDFTLFEGRKLKGWPVMTVVRGNIVAENGQICGKLGNARCALRKKR